MTEPHRSCRLSLFAALKTGGGWLLSACLSAAAAQPSAPETPVAAPESSTVQVRPLSTNPSTTPTTAATPALPPPVSTAWRQLTPRQKEALAPLGAQWSALTAQQQNKWLAVSKNFTQLSVTDQITMHARMSDWVALSPQQRNLARLNFNTLQNLPKEDKKAKWEAYQALSAEEKRMLSAGAKPLTKNAAPTAKPLEAHRQVQTRSKPASGNAPASTAIDRKTLLPRSPALASPAPSAPLPSPAGTPDGARPTPETAS